MLSAPAPTFGLLRSTLLVLFVGLGALAVVALGGAAARPELWSAGLGQVARAVAAGVGTGAAASVALAARLGPAIALRTRTSERRGLAALGWGRGAVVRAWAPVAGAVLALSLVAGLVVEPAAWRAVHGVKGSPAVAAAGWSSLKSGTVRTLADGGAVVLEGDRLRFTTGRGEWTGRAESPRPASDTWSFSAVEVRSAEQGTWTMDRAALKLVDPEAWTAPPSSPWAASLSGLRGRTDEPRARRVLHRRLALIVAVLPLGLVGIGVGWSRRRRALVFGALLPAAVFLVARWSDGALPPVLAGWSPAIVSALAAGWFWRPHR